MKYCFNKWKQEITPEGLFLKVFVAPSVVSCIPQWGHRGQGRLCLSYNLTASPSPQSRGLSQWRERNHGIFTFLCVVNVLAMCWMRRMIKCELKMRSFGDFFILFTVCWVKTKEFKSVDYNRAHKRSKTYHKPNKNYSNISWDAWSEAIDSLIWYNRCMLTAALTWITFWHFCFFTLFQLIYFGPQKEKMSLLQLFRDKSNCKKAKQHMWKKEVV